MAVAQDSMSADILEVAQRCGIPITAAGRRCGALPFCRDSNRSGHLYLSPIPAVQMSPLQRRELYGRFTLMRGIDTKTAYKELLHFTGQMPDIILNKNNVVKLSKW